MSLKYSVTAL